ncbi:hypothetical protein BDW42DRAFT_190359 [Aspergillus taichungensis]|uniref:Uncharacterized protein n=1 Tax=Aspergillus taichungensis TaxID=482145 RepID=A0A2J5I807_9EURO|nr:hypothetical protein BDW42DRAFT_190359 [Aspergillus taichungensis]
MALLNLLTTNGLLTQNDIDRETASCPSAVNEPNANGITPLLMACVKGHLDTVTRLLASGADPNHQDNNGCTALSLAARTHSPNQAAIIRALLAAPQAEVDATCPHLKGNTPLMNVVQQTRDVDSIAELVKSGASLTVRNRLGQTAEDLARESGDARVLAALRPQTDKQALLATVIWHIVSVVQMVLYILNQPLKSGVRLLSDWYGFTPQQVSEPHYSEVMHCPQPKEKPEGEPAPPQKHKDDEVPATPKTPSEIDEEKILEQLANIGRHIENSQMSKFTGLGDDFLATLAKNTKELREDLGTDLGKPQNLPDMFNLALYKPVIYCDDSGSMQGDRYDDQKAMVGRIARVATRIIPEHMGIDLRFINAKAAFTDCREDQILKSMTTVTPRGTTPLGKNLKERVLNPLIHNPLERGESLKRPYLISIITDGRPDDQELFINALQDCKYALEAAECPEYSVVFLISQIGDDTAAKRFMKSLQNDETLREIIHCTSTSLDSTFRNLRDNERALEVWLLKTLVDPIYRCGHDFARGTATHTVTDG